MSMVVGREAPTTPGCLKKLLKTRSMASHGHRKVCIFNLNLNIWFSRKIQICKLHLVLCVADCVAAATVVAALCCSQCSSYCTVLQQVAHQLPHQCSPSCNTVQLFFCTGVAISGSPSCNTVQQTSACSLQQVVHQLPHQCSPSCNTVQQAVHCLLHCVAACSR